MRGAVAAVALALAAAVVLPAADARRSAGEHYGSPAWSPDGRRIAFQGDGGVFVVNAEGGDPQRVASGFEPAWSPDGTKLVFSKRRPGARCTGEPGCTQLGILDLRLHAFRAVPNTWDAYDPAWSPGGRWIAWDTGHEGSDWTIHAVHPNGTSPRVVADANGAASFTEPTWSPDGERLAFAVNGSDGSSPEPGLGIVSRFGGRVEKLARGHALGGPMWSPDGRKIACFDAATGQGRVGILDLPTQRLRRLLAGWHPAWSPDGRRLAFVRGDGIHVMNADGSGVRLLVAN